MFEVNNHTAREIEEKLKERTVGQEQFIQQISSLAVTFMNRQNMLERGASYDELTSDTAFIVGPTGCGKSSVLRQLGNILNIDLTVIDCSRLTPAGYKGLNLSEALRPVIDKQSQFRNKPQIVLFDEADKMIDGEDWFTPISEFLVLLDSPVCQLNYDSGNVRTLRTDRIWFLFAGACQGIEDVVKKRCGYQEKRLGFGNRTKNTEITNGFQIITEDLVKYGFKPELIGRVSSILTLRELTVDEYKQIITHGDRSPLAKLQNTFKSQGIEIAIDEKAKEWVAEKASMHATGARAIQTVLNEFMLNKMGHLKDETNKVVITVDESNELNLQEATVELNETEENKQKDSETVRWKNETKTDTQTVSLEPWMQGKASIRALLNDFMNCTNLKVAENRTLAYQIFLFIIEYVRTLTPTSDHSTAGVKKLLNAALNKRDVFEMLMEDNREKASGVDYMYYKIYDEIKKQLSDEMLSKCINAVEKYEHEMVLFGKSS